MTDMPRADAASQADPRTHPLGYFGQDPWSGAIGTFLWHADGGELLQTLCEMAPAYLDGDELRVNQQKLRAAADQWRDRTPDPSALRDVVAELDPAQFVWLGSLEDLARGGGEFERELRAEFWLDIEDDMAEAAVPDDQLDAFIEFVGHYGY